MALHPSRALDRAFVGRIWLAPGRDSFGVVNSWDGLELKLWTSLQAIPGSSFSAGSPVSERNFAASPVPTRERAAKLRPFWVHGLSVRGTV